MGIETYPISEDVQWDISGTDWEVDSSLSNKPSSSYALPSSLTYEGLGNDRWNVRTIRWLVPLTTKDFLMKFEVSGFKTSEHCTADAKAFVDIEYEHTPGLFARRVILDKTDRIFDTYGPWRVPEIINNNFYNGRRFIFVTKERNIHATANPVSCQIDVFTD